MAKLLRHLGLGGKKSPSPQSRQEYSAQGIQSKAPGTDRCSGIVDESGRFDSLREDTRRHSECSTRTLPLSFESAATRERDWSLRGPNSKDLPVTSSPVDDPSPARINLPGQEGVCPTPTVAAEFVAGEESTQISSSNEVQVCFRCLDNVHGLVKSVLSFENWKRLSQSSMPRNLPNVLSPDLSRAFLFLKHIVYL